MASPSDKSRNEGSRERSSAKSGQAELTRREMARRIALETLEEDHLALERDAR